MKATTAYAIAWIMTGLAVSIGLYFTKNADCLWGMFIPCFISTKQS